MTIVLTVPVLLQLAGAVPSAPPAPPASSALPPVPIIRVQDRSPLEDRYQLDLRLRSPDGPLVADTLTVGDRSGGSWLKSVSEPAVPSCGAIQVFQTPRREISVVLSSARDFGFGSVPNAKPGVMVTARWVRPVSDRCGGLRITEVREVVDVPVGRAIAIEGDGGFVVELRRR